MLSPYFENGRPGQEPTKFRAETTPTSPRDVFLNRINNLLTETRVHAGNIDPKDLLLPTVFTTEPLVIHQLPRTSEGKRVQKPNIVIYSPSDRRKFLNGQVRITMNDEHNLQVELDQAVRDVTTPPVLPYLVRDGRDKAHFEISSGIKIPFGISDDGQEEGIILTVILDTPEERAATKTFAITVPVGFRDLFVNGRMQDADTKAAEQYQPPYKTFDQEPKPDIRTNIADTNYAEAAKIRAFRRQKKAEARAKARRARPRTL